MSLAFVTGAGGFIGSHLCEYLLAEGWDVRAFVRYTSHDQLGALALVDPAARREIDVRAGDLRDEDAVRKAAAGCDAVLHLGALIAIPYSYEHPREVVETNVLGTLNVLEAVNHHQIPCMIHTSTSEVYGTAQTTEIVESHPLQGQSPYSASKIGADKIVESFWRSYGTPVVTIRPFNTYGPRQSPRAVIPTILAQAITGDIIRLGSLGPTRDFTFVEDTVRAFHLALGAGKAIGDIIQLGTGQEVSVGDIVDLAAQLVGHELQVVADQNRMRPSGSEVLRLLSDPTHAREVLDWEAKVELVDGLARTADWLRTSSSWFQLSGYAT